MKVISGKSKYLKKYIEKNKSKDDILFPENGLDPEEQSKFMSDFMKKNPDFQGNIYTYSAYIISDTDSDNFYVVDDNSNKLGYLDFNNFGASVNKINMAIFTGSTIGEVAKNEMKNFQKQIEKCKTNKDIKDLIQKIDRKLGDSVEKMLIIKKIINKEKELNEIQEDENSISM